MWPFGKSWRGLKRKYEEFLATYGSFTTLSERRADKHLKKDLKELFEYASYFKFNRALSDKDESFVNRIISEVQDGAKRAKIKL